MWLLTLSQTKSFGLFQTEGFADDNFKFDKNGRNFSKRVENTGEKGEIARDKQLLLFPVELYDRHLKFRVCLEKG